MIQLPENFETYAEARKAGFLRMKQLKESGRKVVGIFCSFVPTELIEAAGGTAAPPDSKRYGCSCRYEKSYQR